MIIECGPAHDVRTLSIELPTAKRIGVMVSGGIDSTLLYYLLLKLKHDANSDHYIRPFTVLRKEGSKYYASPAVAQAGKLFNISNAFPTIVGDTTLPEQEQVKSGVEQAFMLAKMEMIFIGVISARDEHLIGFDKPNFIEQPTVKFPFAHLEKSHVIDLYYKLNIEHLLETTHSCDHNELHACNACNGCNERNWGFTQLGHYK